MSGELFEFPTTKTHPLRDACKHCGAANGSLGRIVERGFQDTVRCGKCDAFLYNAPRVETGRAQRSVTTIHNGVKPAQRNRILERDGHRCACGASGDDAKLSIDHILSVKDGLAEGFTETELNDDVNLMTLCAECNAGKGERSRSLRWFMQVLLRRDLRLRGTP